MRHKRRQSSHLLRLTAALFAVAIWIFFSTLSAQALVPMAGPYTYTDNTYQQIEDGNGNIFDSAGSGCNIDSTTGQVQPCSGTQKPNHYWVYNDGDVHIIMVSGSALEGSSNSADDGIAEANYASVTNGRPVDFAPITLQNAALSAPRTNRISVSAPYRYGDSTFNTIVDAAGNTYASVGFGCNFNFNTGEVQEAAQPKTTSAYTFNSPQCPDPNNPGSFIPANHYWVAKQGDTIATIQVSGRDALTLGRAANEGITAMDVVITQGGRVVATVSNIEIDGSSYANSDSDFDARCIQEIGVLNWILCPIINFAIDKVAIPIQNIVLDLLETDPLLTAPATDNNSVYIYNAWSQFRTLANALLAIGFIIMIYMMLFSQNNTYSIQRMLPRLVVIALLIQVSYFIAAAMVDMGNVAANGIANIFDAVRQNAISQGIDYSGNGFENAMPDSAQFLSDTPASRGVGAAFGVILAVIGFGLWTYFVPGVVLFFAFGLMLSVLGVFLALALRQLAIVVFVVIAPIAFIAGLFPSTEKYMKEWFDNLGKLIFIYPLIALVFGAGSLLSYLAISTDQSEVNMIIGSAIGLIVLFAIPALFKFAGQFFRGFTAMVTNLTARSKSAAQGDANNPLSWKSNINFEKAQRQLQFYERAGKVAPYSRRILRPSWKTAQIFNTAAQRMQGVVSPTHPANLRRIYWGGQPFKSLAGYANWKPNEIADSDAFSYEIKTLLKSPPMLYSTVDQALQDSGFLFDRALNYTWGIHRMYKTGEVDRDTAGLLWGAYQSKIKGQGHRLFFGAADPSLLLDHDYANPADLGHKWFADNLNQISDPKMRAAVHRFRQSSTEDFGNAGTERETGASWRYAARWLNDESYLDTMMRTPNNQRNINAIETLKRKADTMNVKLNDPRMRAEMIARMEAVGDDSGARVGGYGQSGQAIRHMEEFVEAANHAYRYMQARGVHFTDEINEFN